MRPRVHLVLVAVQLLFVTLAIAGRHVLSVFPAGGLMLVRVVGAASVLFGALALRGGPWVRDPRDLRRLLLLGLFGIAANTGLFVAGLARTTAINATILVTTVPVFTVLLSVLTRREPASALKLSGIALAAAGTVFLIGPDRITLAPHVALGNALIVIGMMCQAWYFIASRTVLARYDSLTVSAYVMAFAIGGALPVGVAALRSADLGAPTILTYLLNIWALRRVSHNVVAVYIYIQPVITALVAPLLLEGEELTGRAALAASAIFAGVGMVLWAEQRQRREVPLEALGE